MKRHKASLSLAGLVNQLTDVKQQANPIESHRRLCIERLVDPVRSEEHEGFKGCSWSPDSQCVLTAQGNRAEIYEVSEKDSLIRAVQCKEVDAIYDYAWYPQLDSAIPETCCFASLTRSMPIHLWDAFQSNRLRASYSIVREDEEQSWAVSLALDSHQIFAGSKGVIMKWAIERPGSPLNWYYVRPHMDGIISCFGRDDTSVRIATGSYNGKFAVYDAQMIGRPISAGQVDSGQGITQIEFSKCGSRLFLGTRRSKYIYCYDTRKLGTEPLYTVPRECRNNQRLRFCWFRMGDKEMLISGESTSKNLLLYELGGSEPRRIEQLSDENSNVVNGISFSARSDSFVFASGTRSRPSLALPLTDEDSETETQQPTIGGTLSLARITT